VTPEQAFRRRDLAGFALLALAIGGLLIRTTSRDSTVWTAPLFYGLSPFVTSVLVLGAGLVWLINARTRAFLVCLLVSSVAVGVWWLADRGTHVCVVSEKSFDLVLWNVWHGAGSWHRIAPLLADDDADLIALVEAGEPGAPDRRFWRGHLPDHDVAELPGGFTVLVRGAVLGSRLHGLDGESRCGVFEVQLDQTRLNLIVVDLRSNPLVSRRVAIERLQQLIDTLPDRPLVVAGDFNTPVDSVWLEPLHERWAHALKTAGNGSRSTWPVPFPFLALDHVWAGNGLDVECAETRMSTVSDHVRIHARLAINPAFRSPAP